MTKLHTFLATSLLCLGVTACGDSSLLAPQAPRFDGGSTFGGGNRTEGTEATTTELTGDGSTTGRGGHTYGSGNRAEGTATASTETTPGGDTTERGGHGFGSGNRTETTTTSTTTERGGLGFGSGN